MIAPPVGRAAVAAITLCVLLVLGSCADTSSAQPIPDLQIALRSLGPGQTLDLADTTYTQNTTLAITTPGVTIRGHGATVRATNAITSSLQVRAAGVTISDLTLMGPPTDRRYSGLDQHRLVIQGDDAHISGVRVYGSAAAGIFVFGARRFRLDDVDVRDTRADGIHVTHGATDGTITGAHTTATGDDGIAVVSYGGEEITSGIAVRDITVSGTHWGRGISVVGGRMITIDGFTVSDTNAAGLYIAAEGSPYNTQGVSDVTATRGSLRTTNLNPLVVQGAMLVSARPGESVTDVRISGVSITGTPLTAQRDVGAFAHGGRVEDLVLSRIDVRQSLVPPFATDLPPTALTLGGWTVDGRPTQVR
ncbi:right-handed parallel beta-helix repeat-containing protein [Gordonia sp. NPDC003376]